MTTGGAVPLSLFATDNKTLVGGEVDIAYAVGELLGLQVEVLPVAWADWPLGIASAKYEAVLSNVTVRRGAEGEVRLRHLPQRPAGLLGQG